MFGSSLKKRPKKRVQMSGGSRRVERTGGFSDREPCGSHCESQFRNGSHIMRPFRRCDEGEKRAAPRRPVSGVLAAMHLVASHLFGYWCVQVRARLIAMRSCHHACQRRGNDQQDDKKSANQIHALFLHGGLGLMQVALCVAVQASLTFVLRGSKNDLFRR